MTGGSAAAATTTTTTYRCYVGLLLILEVLIEQCNNTINYIYIIVFGAHSCNLQFTVHKSALQNYSAVGNRVGVDALGFGHRRL